MSIWRSNELEYWTADINVNYLTFQHVGSHGGTGEPYYDVPSVFTEFKVINTLNKEGYILKYIELSLNCKFKHNLFRYIPKGKKIFLAFFKTPIKATVAGFQYNLSSVYELINLDDKLVMQESIREAYDEVLVKHKFEELISNHKKFLSETSYPNAKIKTIDEFLPRKVVYNIVDLNTPIGTIVRPVGNLNIEYILKHTYENGDFRAMAECENLSMPGSYITEFCSRLRVLG